MSHGSEGDADMWFWSNLIQQGTSDSPPWGNAIAVSPDNRGATGLRSGERRTDTVG